MLALMVAYIRNNLSKAHETRGSLAATVCSLSWNISIHFVTIHSCILSHSHNLQKKTKLTFRGFKVIRGH